ncbi:2TM domain-containing protein [Yeosuana sp. MJ-SS3]|uniref:2TM domain-containing protein n=2 Tax=Gilvirhabdus luticola TaxID=3079858 RepID=A0ABU3U7Y2_9FLAO|nr:2TM domain-containing protein [Yeosuana sp. MJ-SS3]
MERVNKNNQDSYSQKEFKREEVYFRAEKRLKELKGFYWHLFWYLAVNIFIIVSSLIINSTYFNIGHFNAYSTVVFWGIGIGIHAITVFGKNIVFSKSWEDRQIQKFIEKDKKQWE